MLTVEGVLHQWILLLFPVLPFGGEKVVIDLKVPLVETANLAVILEGKADTHRSLIFSGGLWFYPHRKG